MAILCGSDLSAASAGALDVALALAAQRGDRELVLVHVVDNEAELEAARTQLDAAAAAKRGAIAIRAELVVGPAAPTLLSFADTEGSDLIVIAAHSSVGSSQKLGAIAERVIATTRVPVVVVRDPAPWLAHARGDRPLRVLLGVDDSAACELGMQWVHAQRARGPVQVVLGAIYYPDEAAAHYGLHARALVDRDPEVERLLERDLLRKFGDNKGVVARARRGLGRIGDHVVELARDEAVDVIMVGTTQRTGLGRLGSVSHVIVHTAPQSVVCVPPTAALPTIVVPSVRSVLVATDLSAFANRAVPYAFALAPETGEVHVAHVINPGAGDADVAADDAELTAAQDALAPAGTRTAAAAHVVRGDDAATTIAQLAARLGVDLIAIASHGRSGISRALVGSVADRLLRATHVPVLVLRPT